jgi:hypothetical protein
MSAQNKHVFRDEEEAGGKTSRKAKESPFMMVGKWKYLKLAKKG